MNKYLVSTLTLATFLGTTAAPALADQSPSPSGLRREFNQEINDFRKETQKGITSRIHDFQAKLKEKRDENRSLERNNRITKFWKKTGERLQKLINRETKSADKIAARLQKFKDAGKNVSSQEALLATARLKIGLAQTALNDATAQINALVIANKPAEALAKARELHKGVVAAIRTAHKALVDVLVATRGLSVTPTPTPTP